MTRKEIVVIVALLFAGAVVGSVVTAHFTMQSDDVPCVAGQDEICASAAWVKTAKKFQEQSRAANELGNKLNAAVPGGFHIDQVTGLKFLKNAVPPPPPVPVPQPQPTAPAKK